MTDASMTFFTRAWWDERYGGHGHVWSGRANRQLIAYAGDVMPGCALDVGCGEGGDAIWLAKRGWTVTGVDISPVGLARAADHAAAAGPEIASRTTWRQADLFADAWTPFDEHDLVSSHYLHLPVVVRDVAFARLAAAVAPGGHLLVVAHHPFDLEIPGLRPNEPDFFCEPDELAGLLDPGAWTVLAAEAPSREERRHGGEPVLVHDAVLLARREPAAVR